MIKINNPMEQSPSRKDDGQSASEEKICDFCLIQKFQKVKFLDRPST
jgi:hypothetical protein